MFSWSLAAINKNFVEKRKKGLVAEVLIKYELITYKF